MPRKVSLRERNRLTAMRLVQSTAIDRFEEASFDSVTIEAIAEAAGVSASTIYRHFGTKEALVLWDERDRVIDQEIETRLGVQPPIDAFAAAVIVGLCHREDTAMFFRRLRLIYAIPSVGAAAMEQDLRDRADLAVGFALAVGRKKATVADEVLAGTCLVALDVALDHWQRSGGDSALEPMIREAIDAIGALEG